MKTLTKKLLIAAMAAASLSFATISHAQWAVIDIFQQIQQVLAWTQQYQQMIQSIQNQVQQIQHARKTFDAMTGNRGIGNLLNGPAEQEFRRYLPADLRQIHDFLSAKAVPEFRALNTRIDTLRAQMSTLPPGFFPKASALDEALVRSKNQLAANRAIAEAAFKNSSDRISILEALMQRINTTQDPKEIGELTARINVEQAMIQNEANRIAVLQINHAINAQQQERREYEEFSMSQRKPQPVATFPRR